MKTDMVIDLSANPALKDLFAGWKIGETYEPKIRFQFNSLDGDTATVSVDRWTIEESGDQEKKEIVTDMNSPVSVVMGMGSSEKDSKESKPREPASAY